MPCPTGRPPHRARGGASATSWTTSWPRSGTSWYGFDLIVHRWDIATGAGLPARLSDDELDILEAVVPTFGEHLYAEGICTGPLDVGPDADRSARVLAVLGRAA